MNNTIDNTNNNTADQVNAPKRGRPAGKRLVCGVGINDTTGQRHTKAYDIWRGMLQRSYDQKWVSNNPSYQGCSVDTEWHTFSTFQAWYDEVVSKLGHSDFHLDKDIFNTGNKVYSRFTCLPISAKMNTFVLNNNARKGIYPCGVSKSVGSKSYQARVNWDNVLQSLGNFATPEEAHTAYKHAKRGLFIQLFTEELVNLEAHNLLPDGQSATDVVAYVLNNRWPV